MHMPASAGRPESQVTVFKTTEESNMNTEEAVELAKKFDSNSEELMDRI
jgi:hypothetical protein